MTGEEREQDAEDDRLDEALHEVSRDDAPEHPVGAHLVGRGLPEGARGDAEPRGGDHRRAEEPGDVGEEREERDGDRRREDARHDEQPHRIGAHRLDRVDLLGHAHRAELRGDAGADAPRDHDPAQHRPEFAQHARRDEAADVERRAERRELHARLQREHHAGEEPREEDDRERLHADGVELREEARAAAPPARPRAERAPREAGDVLQHEEGRLDRATHCDGGSGFGRAGRDDSLSGPPGGG